MTSGHHYSRMSTWVVAVALLAACADGKGSTAATDQTVASAASLPPDPQEIDFQASDGQSLQGLYYPGATNRSPVVVLMHWAGGDMADWYEVAPWLQNRGLDNPFTNPGSEPWWDPSWFPSVPDSMSVGVFIFSFRGCGPAPSGCQQGDPDGWLLDAQAAISQAAALEGADPTRIAAIGSSIGADGAPDACVFLNGESPGSCDGALSLSPGSFLNVPYVNAIENLGANNPPVPAWCLAASNEFVECTQAEAADNSAFQTFEIAEGQHGNFLMVPAADPSTMQTMLDFLELIFPG